MSSQRKRKHFRWIQQEKNTMRLMSRVAAALAAVLVAQPMAAQASFSLAAGAALPVGSTSDVLEMGYNATVGLGIKPPIAPIGLRFEGALNGLSVKNDGPNFRMLAGIANVTLSAAAMPMGYLIGGIGMYNSKQEAQGIFPEVSDTDVGFNIGAGLNFPLTGFSTFLEARFHIVDDFKLVPITFGVKF
jgi:hypothetical protein